MVEVLLHGDVGQGSAKEEQEQKADRILSSHLGSLTSTTFSLEGLRATGTICADLSVKCISSLEVAGFVQISLGIFVHVELDISVTIKS